MLDKTVKSAYSVDAAIPNSHNLHSTITQQLQKYTDFKEELITIRQLTTACAIPLELSTAGSGHTSYTKSPPPATHCNADTSNTQDVSGRTENKECWVGETGTVLGNG
jgi:hypothetical protein